MWMIKTTDNELIFRGNSINDMFMLPELKRAYPGANIYRSVIECVNDFCQTAFANIWKPGEIKTQDVEVYNPDTDKTEIKQVEIQEPATLEPAGNTYSLDKLEDGNIYAVIKDSSGVTLAKFAMKEARDEWTDQQTIT